MFCNVKFKRWKVCQVERGKKSSSDLQWTTNSWVVWWTVLQLVQLMKPFASRFPSRPPCWRSILMCTSWKHQNNILAVYLEQHQEERKGELTTGLVAVLSSDFSSLELFNCWSNNWVCSHTFVCSAFSRAQVYFCCILLTAIIAYFQWLDFLRKAIKLWNSLILNGWDLQLTDLNS